MSLDIWLCVSVDTGGSEERGITLFDGNYTHNVTPMWSLAGVYDALYMSDGKRCGDFQDVLLEGIKKMISEKRKFEKLDPPNGWGDYESALAFLIRFTQSVCENPNAIIGVSK